MMGVRLFKLKPLLIMLLTTFKKHGGLDESLSINESIILYYSRH
jgi:hypothetical protein